MASLDGGRDPGRACSTPGDRAASGAGRRRAGRHAPRGSGTRAIARDSAAVVSGRIARRRGRGSSSAEDRPEHRQVERREEGVDVGLGGSAAAGSVAARRRRPGLSRLAPPEQRSGPARSRGARARSPPRRSISLPTTAMPAPGHPAEVEAVLLEPVLGLAHVAPDRRPRDAEALLEGLGSERIRRRDQQREEDPAAPIDRVEHGRPGRGVEGGEQPCAVGRDCPRPRSRSRDRRASRSPCSARTLSTEARL